MSNEELNDICKPVKINERIVFHSNVQYGFAKVIRKIGYYPSFLPICSYFEHSSPPFYDEMWDLKKEFLSDIFFHRKDFVNQWNAKYKGKARVFKSPFVWYKEKEKIEILDTAKGSIFFIHHSREGVDRVNDQKKIIDRINQLDSSFHPVSFCFYYLDILKGAHLPYQKKGYNIITAGNKDNPDFIKTFYHLIKNYKYGLTNSIGGHLLFATNLGISMSYFEELEPIHNTTIANFDESRKRLLDSKTYQDAKKLFRGVHKSVSTEQLGYVNNMLGVHNTTNRFKMFLILYKSFFLYVFYKFKRKMR